VRLEAAAREEVQLEAAVLLAEAGKVLGDTKAQAARAFDSVGKKAAMQVLDNARAASVPALDSVG
jgi:hypothetical protein